MIGLFDSGSGGLSVLQALRAKSPHADIVYFGDIKNAPYGLKSPQELQALAYADIAVLKTMRASEIIAACNSISPSILVHAAEDIPIIEMSLPTAHMLKKRQGQRLLLIATPATVVSQLYQNALGEIISLDALPVPELAGAIEFGAPEGEIETIIRSAFRERLGKKYDVLLLGCTHYPLVRTIIEREAQTAFGTIAIIDPADAVAEEATARFDARGTGKLTFRISKDSELFRRRTAVLFPNVAYTIEVA